MLNDIQNVQVRAIRVMYQLRIMRWENVSSKTHFYAMQMVALRFQASCYFASIDLTLDLETSQHVFQDIEHKK